jgi:predicted murein hydrolase (TIGR00659 family)
MIPIRDVWVYLAATPLVWLTLTLLAYVFAFALYRRSGLNPLVNPVAIAIALLCILLLATHTPYARYFEGAQFVHFLLGPATVALAVPLHEQWPKLRQHWVALMGGLVVGVLVASGSAVLIARALGASHITLASLAPKSVTTPVAMGISEKIGGLPSLTAVAVVLTGIIGAAFARSVLNGLRIQDHAVRGFAVGLAAHGQGVARAFLISEEMGAFAGLAMGLAAVLSAFVLPVAARWLLELL